MGVCVLAPAQAAAEPLTAPVWACDQQGVGVVPGVKTAALLPDPRPAPASPPGLPGALIRADEGGARPAPDFSPMDKLHVVLVPLSSFFPNCSEH